MMQKDFLISLIISTYNRPEALRRVLAACVDQIDKNFEIIVADDGSKPATREVVLAARKQIKQPLTHVWQPDKGYCLAEIRNKGVLAARGDYLVFLDGDCVPARDFIVQHRKLAAPSMMVTGSRALLDGRLTERSILNAHNLHLDGAFTWLARGLIGACNKPFALLRMPVQMWRCKNRFIWRRIKGCNMAAWRADVQAVNGFDESFTSWGHEDADFVLRLFNAGVMRKDGAMATEVFHLWHPESSRQAESSNFLRVKQRIETRLVQAELGLQQHHHSNRNQLFYPQNEDLETHLQQLEKLPPTLSVIVITQDEEEDIARCLKSVAFADEVIVLDSMSTDKTLDIAQQHGATTLQSSHWPGFGAQKNLALENAQGTWILSIDADEEVTPELKQQILRMMAEPSAVAYTLPRSSQFCGKFVRYCGWRPDNVLRLFKRGQAKFSDDLVHEKVLTTGRVGMLTAPLLHYSYRNFEEVLHKLNRYSTEGAAQAFAAGQRSTVLSAVLHGGWAFVRSFVFKAGFLDGATGVQVCIYMAQSSYYKHIKLRAQHAASRAK